MNHVSLKGKCRSLNENIERTARFAGIANMTWN